MAILWFWLVAILLVAYVVLDGFDLGAGAIHLLVARTEDERRSVIASIGPVWDGNEVWLLAAGGTMLFAFPAAFAATFSGFYLPFMIVLWLLIGRGIALKFRNQIDSPAWKPFWDAIFTCSSGLLPLLFGVALANVIRGVPLGRSGQFFEPLWTDWSPYHAPGILDWYTLTVGATALAALCVHGALWLSLKTAGDLRGRARQIARTAWWWVLGLMALATLETFAVQPNAGLRLRQAPWGLVLPLIGTVAWLFVRDFTRREWDIAAFAASAIFLAAMLATALFSLHPYILPASTDFSWSLTIEGSAADLYGLQVGLAWWGPGMLVVVGYFIFVYRRFAGRVGLETTPSYD